jgi:hypothetical protein
MLGGAADYGLAQFNRVMLANAVAAGAEYATLTGASAASANITSFRASVTSVIQNTSNLPNATSSVTVSFSGVSPGAPAPGWYCLIWPVGQNGTVPTWTGATPTCLNGTCTSVPCGVGSSTGYYYTSPEVATQLRLANRVLSATGSRQSECTCSGRVSRIRKRCQESSRPEGDHRAGSQGCTNPTIA